MKKCYKCNEIKPLFEFNNNKNKKDGKSSECRICKIAIGREYNLKNKKPIKIYTPEEKALAIKISKNKYRKNNRQKLRLKNKEYESLNKEKRNCRIRNKRKTDYIFKLKTLLRNRIRDAFKRTNWDKNKQSRILLGADYEIVKLHIEKQFDERMTWSNHGPKSWHIDHIIPLASAKTEDELFKLCHYTNLQPLWWIDNLSKGSKLDFNT